MNVNLKNHPIWSKLEQFTALMNPVEIANKYLNQNQNFKLYNYQHNEKDFYQEIIFNYPLFVELKSCTAKTIFEENSSQRSFKFYFLVKVNLSSYNGRSLDELEQSVAELTLVFDSHFQQIAEEWLVHLSSPFLTKKKTNFDNLIDDTY